MAGGGSHVFTYRVYGSKTGVKWEFDGKRASHPGFLLQLDHEETIAGRGHDRTTTGTSPSGKEGVDRVQLTKSNSVASSGLGEGKGTAAGERDTKDAEGEAEGGKGGNSSGDTDTIRVNMRDGEGDEAR